VRQERPPPPVTISGGPASAGPPVLPEEEPARAPRARTRRGPLVLVALAVLATLGVADLRERAAADQAAAAEAERRRQAVDLVLSKDAEGSPAYEAATDSVTFRALLRVRNAGPRKVTITAVDLPGVLLLAPATLEVGRDRGLELRGRRSCADDLAPLLALDSLPLEVRTERGPEQFDLELGMTLLSGDAVRRACGTTRPGLT
jgi:hypothetical protein